MEWPRLLWRQQDLDMGQQDVQRPAPNPARPAWPRPAQCHHCGQWGTCYVLLFFVEWCNFYVCIRCQVVCHFVIYIFFLVLVCHISVCFSLFWSDMTVESIQVSVLLLSHLASNGNSFSFFFFSHWIYASKMFLTLHDGKRHWALQFYVSVLLTLTWYQWLQGCHKGKTESCTDLPSSYLFNLSFGGC